jgi:lipopolysaccharide export system permease protein
VATGFALLLIAKIAEEFGQTGALPVVLAAWVPAVSGMMVAIALLLHTEDG